MKISTDKVLQNIRCNFSSFIANDQNMMNTCQTQRNPITRESGNVQRAEFAVQFFFFNQSAATVYAALFFKGGGGGGGGLGESSGVGVGGAVKWVEDRGCAQGHEHTLHNTLTHVRAHAQREKKNESSDLSGG